MTKILAPKRRKFGYPFISKKDLDDYVLSSLEPYRYTIRAAAIYFAKKYGINEDVLND